MNDAQALRRDVIATARRLTATGLTDGASGNVSARLGDGFLVTPTGMAYDTLVPQDVVAVAMDGSVAPGNRRPSSEWRFHRDVYAARPEVGAIVHAHSAHATALACARRPIPAFHYMVAVAGGDSIPCAPYATFGTETLSRHVVAALANRDAALLSNHGQIAVGADLARALALASAVEDLARQYWLALQIRDGPVLLDAAEMATVVGKFRTYGRQNDDES